MSGHMASWWDLWLSERSDRKAGRKSFGPKPCMRVGGSGPRGSRFPKVVHPRPPRSVIVKTKYVPMTKYSSKRLSGWIDYCVKDKQYDREQEANRLTPEQLREKEFFTNNQEGLNRDEARELIRDNFGKRVAYHQIILSSGDREVEPKDYARNQMDALERKLGHKLTWVANIHRDTGPDKMHINVTIAGAIPDFHYTPPPATAYRTGQIDIERVADEDKFKSTDGQWYTKYHSKDELQAHSDWLWENKWVDEETFKSKLWHWIGMKEQNGEDYFGVPPLTDRDKEIELKAHRGSEQNRESDRAHEQMCDRVDPTMRQEREREFQKELDQIDNATDRLAHELTRGEEWSPQGVRYTKEAERAASLVEYRNKQRELKETANYRGDVYIDRDTLDAMRAQGNYYVYSQRNFDRELDRAIERELAERSRDRERDRDHTGGIEPNGDNERHKDHGNEEFKQNMPGIMPDSSGDEDRHEKHHREDDRERDDDDDGFRFRGR